VTASLVVICATNSILTKVASANIKHQHMKELDIPVINVILYHSLWQLSSEGAKPQCMKELDIPVISVICKSSVLRQHKASVHEGDRYKCNTCDYKAARKEYL
jgi:hypothetical protein